MTDAVPADVALGLAIAKIADLERQLKDARYCIAMLLHNAGGRVELTPSDLQAAFDKKFEIESWSNYEADTKVMVLRKRSDLSVWRSPSQSGGSPL